MRRRIALGAVAALLATNAVLLLTEPGLALPRALANYFFGPHLVRADVVVRDGGIHEYRLDRGRVVRAARGSLIVREADGTTVVVPVAPDAAVLVDGRPAALTDLVRGTVVTTIREGSGPATDIRAHAK